MKVIVNGKKKDLGESLWNELTFTYDSIVEMAGLSLCNIYTVTFSIPGVRDGSLVPGESIRIPTDQVPMFNVTNTGNA